MYVKVPQAEVLASRHCVYCTVLPAYSRRRQSRRQMLTYRTALARSARAAKPTRASCTYAGRARQPRCPFLWREDRWIGGARSGPGSGWLGLVDLLVLHLRFAGRGWDGGGRGAVRRGVVWDAGDLQGVEKRVGSEGLWVRWIGMIWSCLVTLLRPPSFSLLCSGIARLIPVGARESCFHWLRAFSCPPLLGPLPGALLQAHESDVVI